MSTVGAGRRRRARRAGRRSAPRQPAHPPRTAGVDASPVFPARRRTGLILFASVCFRTRRRTPGRQPRRTATDETRTRLASSPRAPWPAGLFACGCVVPSRGRRPAEFNPAAANHERRRLHEGFVRVSSFLPSASPESRVDVTEVTDAASRGAPAPRRGGCRAPAGTRATAARARAGGPQTSGSAVPVPKLPEHAR